jgi:hypothetical protein
VFQPPVIVRIVTWVWKVFGCCGGSCTCGAGDGGGGPSFDLIVGVAVVAWCWVYDLWHCGNVDYLWNWRRLRMIGSGVMIGLVIGRRFGAAILV